MADPNMMQIFALDDGRYELVERHTVFEFDLKQHKLSTVDFQSAFKHAVLKRVKHAICPFFIGLSSGYDSGAIQVALVQKELHHFAYTIFSTEALETLQERIKWAGSTAETHVILFNGKDLEKEMTYLAMHSEPFQYRATQGQDISVAEDPAAAGLSYICREARRRGVFIYLSGTGADEIISDYGHAGHKIFPHSNFGGLFPDNLQARFPWEGFFLGTQRDYLMKEELVAGAHGVEARYPFLDRAVVQEFLWLDATVKNSKYKAPIHEWLARFDYPFRAAEKVGFNAAHNVRWNAEASLIWSYNVHSKSEARVREVNVENHAHVYDLDGDNLSVDDSGSHSTEQRATDCQTSVGAHMNRLSTWERDLRLLEEHLLLKEQELAKNAADLYRKMVEQVNAQHEMTLRFMALRFVPIQHVAAASTETLFFKSPAIASQNSHDPPMPALNRHSRWSGVEVLTCVSGGRFLSVMDFPVYHIFRTSTPLPVHNVCEDIEWEGMHMRLRMYHRFLSEHIETQRLNPAESREKLFIVSDGMDVVFNDMSEVIEADPDLKNREIYEAVALLTIRRYEAILPNMSSSQAVFSTERLCGWGGGHLCSDSDDERYPEAPADSKYLNAGSYIGPPSILAHIIGSVLSMAERAKSDAALGDLHAKTTAEDAAGGETDQYFFKLFFWEHQDLIALDYHQSLFGNFLEVEHSECYDGWQPRCSFKPCCTVSDSFTRFHETFYGKYNVKGCSIWRMGHLPISWHGNGAGKWLWWLSLEVLSRVCTFVANLTVQLYPVKPIEQLFQNFDAARLLRQHAEM